MKVSMLRRAWGRRWSLPGRIVRIAARNVLYRDAALQLLADLDPLGGREGLGAVIDVLVAGLVLHQTRDNLPLNGGTDGAVDDELGKDTNGARNTEEDGVVVGLGETVVLEEDTRVGVDVGEGVLGLAVLGEDAGRDLVDLANELEHGVLGHLLCRWGKGDC